MVNSGVLNTIEIEPMLPIDPVTLHALVPDIPRTNNAQPNIDLINSPFCKYNCQNCSAEPRFRLDTFETLKQKEINAELKRHRHKTSLWMPEGHFRRTTEGRRELFDHYTTFHRRFFNIV
jgi:hypothetical protein